MIFSVSITGKLQVCSQGSLDKHDVKRCCSEDQPCGENQGDCDDDDECSAGLYCAKNQCGPTFYQGADCCKPIDSFVLTSKCDGGTKGQMEECCDEDWRCGEGQGDCDDDDDCAPGLKCGKNNCDSNFYRGADCCYKGI